MPRFRYRAKTEEGKTVSGEIASYDLETARMELTEQGLFLLDLRPYKGISLPSIRLGFERGISLDQLAIFCRELATMLSVGVPLLTSLKTLARQMENAKIRSMVGEVAASVEEGKSLASSFSTYRPALAMVLINATRAAEKSGTLDELMGQLASHFEKEHTISKKFASAMMYPAIVVSVALVVMIFIIAYVLPIYSDLFMQMGADVPVMTRVMLEISAFFMSYWWIIATALLAIFLTVFYLYRQDRFRHGVESIFLRTPVIGELLKKRALSNFARNMASLQASGVPILTALDVCINIVPIKVLSDELKECRRRVEWGEGLSAAMHESTLIPSMLCEMVAVGEETGKLADAFEKVADSYDRDIDHTTERLTSLIQPVLITVLGVIILTIMLSIIIPMFSVYEQL